MKIAFIHSDKKIGTGAHFINDLISCKLRERGIEVNNFYPSFMLKDAPIEFKGIKSILYFYSLLEKRDKILRHDIIQGTTYTPLAFLHFSKPIVSHFGSTTIGFLGAVPRTSALEDDCRKIFYQMKKDGAIQELDIKTRRPLNDISVIEKYAAERVDYIMATSSIVKNDLISLGIKADKIKVLHNAVEDYWFSQAKLTDINSKSLVFLGRIGEDAFTLKLKGINRLVSVFKKFPEIPKVSIVMSRNKPLLSWLRQNIVNHTVMVNAIKRDIPSILQHYAGGVLFMPSRYEGFSLSLIEAMSQGLVPVAYPVGVAPEIIRDQYNGFIVNNLDEATEKINLLLNDNDLRRNLSLNAFNTAKNFYADSLIDNTVNLYKDILQAK